MESLRARLAEAEEALAAIRGGVVDAIAVDGPQSQRFTQRSADQPYRILAERMSEGAASMSADGIILFCNDRLADMVGHSPEKLVGSAATELVAHSEREYFRQLLARGLEGEARGEVQFQHRNGNFIPVLASLGMIPAEPARGLCLVATDLGELKRAEEARERLAAIVNSSDDAIVGKSLDGTITAWNGGAEKLFGYTASEIVGKSILTLLPPECAHEESEILARIRRGQRVDHFETVRVRKDGTTVKVSVTISPIKDSRGAIIGVSKIARDITERKRAVEALSEQAEELSRQSEELARSRVALEEQTLMLQSVLDSMAEGLAAVNEREEFVLWNPAAEKILGMGAASLPPKEWPEHYGLFLADTQTPFPADQLPLARAIRGEVSTTEMFVRNPAIAGGAWIEVSASPLRDKYGAVRGGVAAFRDITRSKADEREIRRLCEELEIRVMERTSELAAANKELEAFSYSVSHDLRAPLRHISGFSQILLEEVGPRLDPSARVYLDRIQAGTQKMGLLVDELLNLARVGRQALRLQSTELTPLVGEVLAILQPESEGREVKWVIGDLPVVDCDAVLVKQIFQNLLANALKFTRPRAVAVIEVSHKVEGENDEPVLMVRDNGIGFSMKYVDKLFGVFQRLHQPAKFEGTGIGLATVQRIVHKHGGRVWAEGEIDKGATFYFTLGMGTQAGAKSNRAKAGGQS